MTVPFEPHRFRSTAPYYARHRVPYPEALVAFVADRCGLTRESRVLDLGCGPGQLAVGFARLGAAVTAMDSEPEMLVAAQEHAREAGVAVRIVEGSSYDLGAALGRFRLVAMGRSFHWMDRDATLVALDGLIERGGAVVLFGSRRIGTAGADWPALFERLSEEFAPARASERRQRKAKEVPHEAILLRSAFSAIERYGVTVSRALGVDEIVGRAFSISATSPELLADQRSAFEDALREGLARLSPNGEFSETVQVTALIAKRPTDS